MTASPSTRAPSRRGLAMVGAAGIWLVAGVVGVALAALLTAVVVVVGVIGAAGLAVVGLAPRPRRRPKANDPDVIEAHHVGGHSWVAYGWDGH
ncbi:MAG: hypothetical protein ACREEB_05560 [Caulobacteraceae bacterium]